MESFISRVPELNSICTVRCEESHLSCILGCGSDMNCVTECTRDITKCIQGEFNVFPLLCS